MGLERQPFADREDTAAAAERPAIAIQAGAPARTRSLGGCRQQIDFGAQHRAVAHQGLRQLGITHGGVDVFAGGGQQADPSDPTADATEAAPLVPVRHHLHRQAGAQPARIGRGEVGHGLQGCAVAAAEGAKPFPWFDGLAAHHLQIEQASIAISDQRAVITQSRLRHPHGPAGIVNGVAPPLGFGVDVQLHLLPDVDRLPFANCQVGDAVAQLDRPVFAGHHLLGQGGHHFAAGQMAEIGHLLVVDATQGFKALAVGFEFGQGCVPQAPGRDQPVPVPPVEIGVDADQFGQILLLTAQLLLQAGQVEPEQRLAPLHLVPHPQRQRENLALGPRINHRGAAGHDHHATADHLGGHRPEQKPAGGQSPGRAQSHEHLLLGMPQWSVVALLPRLRGTRGLVQRAHLHLQPRFGPACPRIRPSPPGKCRWRIRPSWAQPFSRSTRWVPTRRALAMAVSEGFTAPIVGMKLVSTT